MTGAQEGAGPPVGGEGFVNVQALFGKIFLVSGFVLARDGGINSTEGHDRLHGIIGAEGQMYSIFKKFTPGIRHFGALRADPRQRPILVGEQVIGLHGSDDS